FARDHLNAMDEAVKLSFTKYREAMGILMALYADNLIDPMPMTLLLTHEVIMSSALCLERERCENIMFQI
ncbi:MAG: hypothetical protein NUV74_16930, partial [Candidatus Brocadiaceae bacterium]|nr:hypothetical protein [Candidatus Brocadiaceae bacterium]